MLYFILLTFATCQILSSLPILEAANTVYKNRGICPFINTVNLTGLTKLNNGSYEYDKILIPREKQDLYYYDIKSQGRVRRVSKHLRGCVCSEKPCIKLCCKRNEYLRESSNESEISSCEKITSEMKVFWNLDIKLKNSDKPKNVNIFEYFTIQVGLPCIEPETLDEEYMDEKFILSEDGDLLFPPNDFEDRLNYCYSPVETDNNIYKLKPHLCSVPNVVSWKELLKAYAMTISVVFLIPTIVVYLVLKELRRNLRGKLLICYLFSLTIGYIIISVINLAEVTFGPTTCSIMGFTGYYFSMAAFLWLSVLCYDIWKNFKDKSNKFNRIKHQKQFIRYSLYTWLLAGLATGLSIIMQYSTKVSRKYKPGIGDERCWIEVNRWSAAIYFYGPNLIILLFNVVTFVHLTRKIYKIRTDLNKMTQKDKFFKENAVVIIRLFLVMGITWIFDILSYCLKMYKNVDFLFVITDVINAIQGFLIFVLFVMKPKIIRRLKRLFERDELCESQGIVSTSSINFFKFQALYSAPTANST